MKEEFAHLKRKVSTLSQHQRYLLWALLVGITIAAIAVVFLFLTPHRKPHTLTRESHTQTDTLEKNAKHLASLQQTNKTNSPFSFLQKPAESREIVARRHAPTEVYTSTMTSVKTLAVGRSDPAVLVGENRFAQFANTQNTNALQGDATTLAHPRHTLVEGEFIRATLETAINSDLPGKVRAVVSETVYAYGSDTPLIPAGSRLLGEYTSTASNGAATARVFVIWNRLITPQGISMILNSTSTDALGRAGQDANAIDSHFFKIFGTAALLSIMGAASATVGVSDYDQPNSANQYRESIATAFQQSSQRSLSGNLNIRPTLHVYEGSEINVFVARDVDLYKMS